MALSVVVQRLGCGAGTESRGVRVLNRVFALPELELIVGRVSEGIERLLRSRRIAARPEKPSESIPRLLALGNRGLEVCGRGVVNALLECEVLGVGLLGGLSRIACRAGLSSGGPNGSNRARAYGCTNRNIGLLEIKGGSDASRLVNLNLHSIAHLKHRQ